MSKRVATVDAADPARSHERGSRPRGTRRGSRRRSSRPVSPRATQAARSPRPSLRAPTRRTAPARSRSVRLGSRRPAPRSSPGPRPRADTPLALQPDRRALPRRKAVRDDGRLERDHGVAPRAPRFRDDRITASSRACATHRPPPPWRARPRRPDNRPRARHRLRSCRGPPPGTAREVAARRSTPRAGRAS